MPYTNLLTKCNVLFNIICEVIIVDGNGFIEKTKNVLSNYNKACFAGGFSVIGEQSQDCVLIMGMNPAGNDETEGKEKDKLQLYYVPVDIELPENCIQYPKYFKPIYEFVSHIYGEENVKWDWCNYSFDNKFDGATNEFREYFNTKKQATKTILIADMFYYHETSQSEFLNLINKEVFDKDYLEKMLDAHINAVKEKEMNIDFIYINNATLSNMMLEKMKLLNENIKDTSVEYKGYKIFFGGMLSGQRRIDNYSRIRLENEIKDYLQNNKKL